MRSFLTQSGMECQSEWGSLTSCLVPDYLSSSLWVSKTAPSTLVSVASLELRKTFAWYVTGFLC